nr:RNA-directed DNA polymerase, eukaryota, reverse transcriptase zinc-binding domain protein [Tanacetum cinerariifolium]
MWKAKILSIGGRLTLLKSVLCAIPLYTMSIYKAPKGVLHEMEMIRNKFFIGADSTIRKINWVAWDKVLASKKHGGLGVSSYYALNRALLLKWVWHFISQDERTKSASVAVKKGASSLNASFQRQVRDGVKSHQWSELNSLLDICSVLDDLFLPSSNEATRWAKYVPIK